MRLLLAIFLSVMIINPPFEASTLDSIKEVPSSSNISIRSKSEYIKPQTRDYSQFGPFFLINGNFLITNVGSREVDSSSYQIWKKYRRKIWRSEDIENLHDLGFKAGDKFDYLDFKTGNIKSYILKEKVNIAMIKHDFYGESPDIPYFRTFYILLDDSPEKHTIPNATQSDEPTGIAVHNEKFKLKSSVLVQPNFEEVVDINKVKDFIKKANSPELSEFKNYYYISKEETKRQRGKGYIDGLKLKIKNDKTLKLTTSNINSYYNFQMGDFVEGADLVILQEQEDMHSCPSLYIIRGEQVETFNLNCDSGGC